MNINLGPGHVEWFFIPIEPNSSYDVMRLNMQEAVSRMLSKRDKYFVDFFQQYEMNGTEVNSKSIILDLGPQYGNIRYGFLYILMHSK